MHCIRRRPRCCTSRLSKFLVISLLAAWLVIRLTLNLSPGQPVRSAVSQPPTAGHIYRRRSTNAAADNVPVRSASQQPLAGIPRILHQTWKSYDAIPETFRSWMESWIRLNPEWEYWFWSDDDIRAFIASAYPDYLDLYDAYPGQGYRVDFFRYFVLYEFGGLYVDLDMECLRPFEEYLASHSFKSVDDCIVSQEPIEHALFLAPHGVPLVSNALMACRPRHPFFARVTSGLSWYASGRDGTAWNDVLRATGPYMLTVAYREYVQGAGWVARLLGLSSADGKHSSLQLAEADDFHPSPDDSMVDYMRQVCVESRRSSGAAWLWAWLHDLLSSTSTSIDEGSVCERLSAYDFGRSRSSSAFATHHWTHSWVGRRNDPWGLLNDLMKRFSVEELIDDRLRIRSATNGPHIMVFE